MSNLTRFIGCVGILHEAYCSFKSRARSVRNEHAYADAEQANPDLGTDVDCGAVTTAAARGATTSAAAPECTSADPAAAAAAAAAGGRHFLRFCLLVTVAAYAERFGDRVLARLPLYSLAKLALTVAIMAPNQALRDTLYGYLHPQLLRADAAFQLHSTRALRRSSYQAQSRLLAATGWLLQCTLPYVAARQLDEVNDQAARLAQLTKREKTRRLQASVDQLPPLCSLPDDDDESGFGGDEGAQQQQEQQDQQWLDESDDADLPLSPRGGAEQPPSADREADGDEQREQCGNGDTSDAESLDTPLLPLASGMIGLPAAGENVDPNVDCTAAEASTAKSFPAASYASPACSPTRLPRASPHAHARTPSTLSVSSGVCPSTPTSSAAAAAAAVSASPVAPSVLSHRLHLLSSRGHQTATLRERTHTPQKSKLWAADPNSDEFEFEQSRAQRIKRQTMV